MGPGRARHILLIALAAATSACASAGVNAADLPARELTGHFTVTSDGNWFRPCTLQSERWWVTLTGRSVEQVQRARAEGRVTQGQPVFVRWTAAVTDGRVVGPGGPALLAREVLELRAPTDADCGVHQDPDTRRTRIPEGGSLSTVGREVSR